MGGKLCNSSCKPRKYQGAFAGLGVFWGFANSSRGAFINKDIKVKYGAKLNALKNYLKKKYGG